MVFIHADADGTYTGNGGFIMLNELAHQLRGLGYDVAFFDHLDRLHPALWEWTGYPIPQIVPFSEVLAGSEPIVTTWLYCWLDVLESTKALWSRLRYWCSGELLRADPMHDRARAYVHKHLGGIAINNPSLASYYYKLGVLSIWHWTNWVRDAFFQHNGARVAETIGFQPDERDPDTLKALIERYGVNRVVVCTGDHLAVAKLMQSCDLYLSWNNTWPMVFGPGESFGLNMYEAMAAGSVTVGRKHGGNHTADIVPSYTSLHDAFNALDMLLDSDSRKAHYRNLQGQYVEQLYRFDIARETAIRSYL